MNDAFKTAEDVSRHLSAGKAIRSTRPKPGERARAQAPPRRDEFPDYAERARRLGDLIAAPALPLADAALFLDVPLSTLDKLRAQGRGPRTFKIGRRLYVRQIDLRLWLDELAEAEAA